MTGHYCFLRSAKLFFRRLTSPAKWALMSIHWCKRYEREDCLPPASHGSRTFPSCSTLARLSPSLAQHVPSWSRWSEELAVRIEVITT